MNIIYQDSFILPHKPSLIAAYILQADKVKAYYPLATEIVQINKTTLACKSLLGNSIIEQLSIIEGNNSASVTTKVYGIFKLPKTLLLETELENIKASAFFTMVEEWQLESLPNDCTQLKKTWCDIKKLKLQFLPLAALTRIFAKYEHHKLLKSWS